MDNKPQSSGAGPPPKPWERSGSSSGPGPFKPPSPGSTSDVVEASGTAKPGEIVQTGDASTAINRNSLGRPVPPRPWEQQTYGANTYGYGSRLNSNFLYNGTTYGSGVNYNTSYGAGTLGGAYGGVGGAYGGGLYGNNMYRGGSYGGLYGGGGAGMFGGGLYGGGVGGPMGGYGMGGPMGGGPYGDQDPNNPFGGPPSPPGFWVSVMRVMQGVVTFFGRIAILIDQNTQAFHMFMSALLQLFDRSGMLYGELARFVLRLLGVRTPKRVQPPGPNGQPGPHNQGGQAYIEGAKAAPPSGAWDGVWGNNSMS